MAIKSEDSIIQNAGDTIRVRGEALAAEIWRGRQWSVTDLGLECRDGAYFIAAGRLVEELTCEPPRSWLQHMGSKTWIDYPDFCTAFFVACAVHRAKLRKADVAVLREHISRSQRDIRRRPFWRKAKEQLGLFDSESGLEFFRVSRLDEIEALAEKLANEAGE